MGPEIPVVNLRFPGVNFGPASLMPVQATIDRE